MAKDTTAPEPSTAPEINPDHINLDVDSDSKPAEPSQTIEEAQAAADTTEPDNDEALYKAAASDMAVDEPAAAPQKPKRSKKKLLTGLLILLLLAGAGAAAWYFFLRDKPQPAAPATEPAPVEQTALSYVPETIAYAFRDGDNNPYTLFWRPAGGGDRSQVQILNRSASPSHSDSYGSNVVFAADEKIYTSTDYGKSYTQVFESEPGAQITDVKLSSDGKLLAFGYYPDGSEKNTVKTIQLDGKDSKDLFTATKPGVDILGWNSQRMVYTENCYGCDGSAPTPYTRNLTDNKSTKLLEDTELKEITSLAVPGDVTKLLYVQGVDDGAAAEGLEAGVTAPYKVMLLDLASNKTETLATIGTADEKNPNGTTRYRNIQIGFLAGSVTPYYVDGTTLYTVSGSEPNAFYKSESAIQFVSFASESNVIVAHGDSLSDYSLTNFAIESNEGVAIFQGNANTVILGVTTK